MTALSKAPMPSMLYLLLFLSAISSIYGLVNGLLSALVTGGDTSAALQLITERIDTLNVDIQGWQTEMRTFFKNLLLSRTNYGAGTFLFSGIEFVGVYLMFRLKKLGFVLYVLSQIGLSALPVIFGGISSFSLVLLAISLVWSALWVILYAIHLRYMQ